MEKKSLFAWSNRMIINFSEFLHRTIIIQRNLSSRNIYDSFIIINCLKKEN